MLLGQVDKIILVNLMSPAVYGIYVVTYALSRVLTVVGSAVVPVLLPKSAGRGAAEVTAMTTRALSVTTPLMALGTLGLVAFGAPALRMVYGPEFGVGYLPLCVMSVEALVSSVVYVVMQPYLALNRPGVVTAIQVASVPLLCAAIWWLVPRFGATGAAMGLLTGAIFRALCVFLASDGIECVAAARVAGLA